MDSPLKATLVAGIFPFSELLHTCHTNVLRLASPIIAAPYLVAFLATAMVRPQCVDASCIIATLIALLSTLIDVFAGLAIAAIASLASACIATNLVLTHGVRIAIRFSGTTELFWPATSAITNEMILAYTAE